MRPDLLAWEQSRAATRQVWFDGSAIRTARGVLLLVRPSTGALAPLAEPRTGVSAPLLAAFLAQAGSQDPREVAALLDAHLDRLLG